MSGQAPPSVVILIPVLNEEKHIRRAVCSARTQDHPGLVQIVFLDGGSTDQTVDLLRRAAHEDARIRILHNGGRTPPAALNLGIAATDSDYVARFDAHADYPSTYLSTGIARLEESQAVGVAGPQIAVGTGGIARAVSMALSTWLGSGSASFRFPTDQELETDSTFTGVWRRADLRCAGSWDEEAYPNEDVEMSTRLRSLGRGPLLCVPEMAATYTPRDSFASLSRQYWRYGKARSRTFAKHPQSLRRTHLLPPSLCVALLAATTRVPVLGIAARLGLAIYLSAILSVSVSKGRVADRGNVILLPAIFVTMHLSWGGGFIRGLFRRSVLSLLVSRSLRDGQSPTDLDHVEPIVIDLRERPRPVGSPTERYELSQ